MQTRETKQIQIGKLVMPGGWTKRLDEDTVDELVESFGRVGQLVPVGIAPDRTVLWGCHRVAAAKKLGWKTVMVQVAEPADEADAEAAAIQENLVRRTLPLSERAVALKRLKELYEAEHPETKAGASQAENKKRAHRKSMVAHTSGASGRAKRAETAPSTLTFTAEMAAKTGRSERAIQEDLQLAKLTAEQLKALEKAGVTRKRMLWIAALPDEERRAAAVEEAVEDKAVGREQPEDDGAGKNGRGRRRPLPVEGHGVDVPDEYADAWALVVGALADVDVMLRRAQGRLTKLKEELESDKVPAAVRQRIPQAIQVKLQAAAAEVRGAVPAHACVNCKLVPHLMENCGACRGSGFLTEHQIGAVPKELLLEGEKAGVFVNGKFKKLTDVRA